MQTRPLLPHEEALVWQFLALAAHENRVETAQNTPALAIYAENWGRAGDCGLVGYDATRKPIGLIWARLFPETAPGYGWMSAEIPEIALAVRPENRGQGVGRMLLEQFLETYRPDFPGFSLSVRSGNEAALRLYERAGFITVPERETINRVGGASFVMVLRRAF